MNGMEMAGCRAAHEARLPRKNTSRGPRETRPDGIQRTEDKFRLVLFLHDGWDALPGERCRSPPSVSRGVRIRLPISEREPRHAMHRYSWLSRDTACDAMQSVEPSAIGRNMS